MAVVVSSNIKQVKKRLSRVARRQVPFAVAGALNTTAFEVRKFVIERLWPNSFPRAHNKRFPKFAFRVKKAHKKRPVSMVYDSTGRPWMRLHIDSGTKLPRSRPDIAIPVPQNVRRLASGRISEGKLPDNLKNSFATEDAVFQRYGGRRQRRVRMMYRLRGSASIRRVFPFYKAGGNKARTVFPQAFAKSLRRALRTAR